MLTMDNPKTSVRGRREELIRELQLLDAAAIRIRAALNSTTNVSVLPIEIFTHIFTLCASTSIVYLIHISHVCRQWRQIALNTPQLWTRIGLPLDSGYLHMAIERSKPLLLDVAIYEPDEGYDDYETVQTLLREFPRIQRLVVASEEPAAFVVGQEFHAPRLESLDLECWGDYGTTAFVSALCSTPMLQSLKFPVFPGCWDWICRQTTLRHLSSAYELEEEMTPPLPIFHAVVRSLCHLTSLETLHLQCHFRLEGMDVHSVGNPTPLPLVTKLKLAGPAIHCAAVLSHFSFPSLVEANFQDVNCEAGDDEVIANALIPISRTLSSRTQDPRTWVSLSVIPIGSEFHLIFTAIDGEVAGTRFKASHLQFWTPLLPAQTIHERLLPHLPMDLVAMVSVCQVSREVGNLSAVSSIVKAARNVERLDFFCNKCEVLPAILGFPQSAPAIFPRLRILHVTLGHPTKENTCDECVRYLLESLQTWGQRETKIPCLLVCTSIPLSAEHKTVLEACADKVLEGEEAITAYLAGKTSA